MATTRKSRLAVTASLLTFAFSSQPALAWGPLGHRITATIAQDNISGRTAAAIEQIVGDETLADGSTWPDDQRSNPTTFWQETASPWHYVTAPDGVDAEDIVHPEAGDALTALEGFVATLRDPGAATEEKALALRFVVHIAADLHNPLHAGNGTDKGGNDVKVLWFDMPTNLHWVWDEGMLLRRQYSFTEYADLLERRINAADTLAWWNARPQDWINESIEMRPSVYPQMGGEQGAGTMESPLLLNWQYQYDHVDQVEHRLAQAGIRVAAYLDWIFAPTQ